jgi:hypothetical protein
MRLRKRFVTLAVVATGGLMAAAPGAFGAQSPNASCVGAGSSALAPGQGGQFAAPGARAVVSQDVLAMAQSLGVPPGSLVAGAAQAKGTAQECFPGGPP